MHRQLFDFRQTWSEFSGHLLALGLTNFQRAMYIYFNIVYIPSFCLVCVHALPLSYIKKGINTHQSQAQINAEEIHCTFIIDEDLIVPKSSESEVGFRAEFPSPLLPTYIPSFLLSFRVIALTNCKLFGGSSAPLFLVRTDCPS